MGLPARNRGRTDRAPRRLWMSPVVVCFGALDAALIAQAAYAARELRAARAKDEEKRAVRPTEPPRR